MDPHELVVIHCNAGMPHQVRQAEAWTAGLTEHHQRHICTTDPAREGDVHVVLGPNYALHHWRAHSRTVLLDRAHWGDPAYISLGWWNPVTGARDFPAGQDGSRWLAHRPDPFIVPPDVAGTLVFGDYGQAHADLLVLFAQLHRDCTYRSHPHDPWPDCPVPQDNRPLEQILRTYADYYGWHTSALTAAALAGHKIHALSSHHVCARLASQSFEAWCYDLAWSNWRETEIATGDAWSWLCATEPDQHSVE